MNVCVMIVIVKYVCKINCTYLFESLWHHLRFGHSVALGMYPGTVKGVLQFSTDTKWFDTYEASTLNEGFFANTSHCQQIFPRVEWSLLHTMLDDFLCFFLR